MRKNNLSKYYYYACIPSKSHGKRYSQGFNVFYLNLDVQFLPEPLLPDVQCFYLNLSYLESRRNHCTTK